MKHAKKLTALFIVLTLLLSLSATAFAAEDLDSNSNKYTIKIGDGVNGQSYTAYKVFDVTLATAGGNASNSGFTYTVKNDSAWWDTLTKDVTADTAGVYQITAYGLTFTPSATDPDTYVVTSTMTTDQAALLAAALNADTTKPSVAGSIASYGDAANTIDVTSSGLGYYFIDTSLGALCSLDTTNQDATIYEKNSQPTLAKTVKEDSDNTWGASASADIGQTVNFKLTVGVGNDTSANLGTGVDKDYVITDTLPDGMTYTGNTYAEGASEITGADHTATVAISGWTLGTDMFVEYNSNILTITLKAEKLKTLAKDATFDITYGASLDADCVLAGAGNVNTATLTYGTYVTPQVSATVYTYAMALKKYNSDGEALADATFSFPFTAEQVFAGSGTEPAVYKIKDATTGTTKITTPASGVIIVVGLDEAEYSITETEAPAGYNLLTQVETITVHSATAQLDTDVDLANDVKFIKGTDDTVGTTTYMIAPNSIAGVLNQTGAELPSTGGIGTTIFYVLGGLLAAGALVLLITNKRMKPEN